MREPPRVIVVTGIQASGKSTVARLLARRFARAAHVEADVLHQMIVSGADWVEEPGPPSTEAARQLRLRLRQMCGVGKTFWKSGFTAILDDIILAERWDQLRGDLDGVPFSLFVLAPRIEVVVESRDVRGSKRPLGEAWARYLDARLRETMSGVGVWIDTSDQAPAQTVDRILDSLKQEETRTTGSDETA